MGSRRSLRERFLVATLVVAVAALIVVRSPSWVESSESSNPVAQQKIAPGSGWERGFPYLAVGP